MNRSRTKGRVVWFLLPILTAVVLTASIEATAKAPAGDKSAEPLKAVDKDGLPVPENVTDYSGEQSRFFRSVTASAPSTMKAVLAFYRRELPLAKWKELPGAVEGAEKTRALYENKDHDRLEMKLTAKSQKGTDIVLEIKSKGPAEAEGVLPAAGKARIYLGNMTENPVEFTIEKKKYTVKKESTSDNSMKDAPFVEVTPGSHPFTLIQKGQKPAGDKILVGADETWGLIAGPGGALPVRIY
jgi:hypothetical protein